jgi:hypothetical protein
MLLLRFAVPMLWATPAIPIALIAATVGISLLLQFKVTALLPLDENGVAKAGSQVDRLTW